MEALWYGLLFGLVIGVGFTLLGIFTNYKVERREWWEEWERTLKATQSCLRKAVAENAKVHVALAVAEIADDARKVATMTMAALDTDISVPDQSAQQDGCDQSNHCS
jgi:hypothetical protein